MSLRKSGEELGLARGTIRKDGHHAPALPLPTPRPLRARTLDPSEDSMLTRLSQGCLHAAQLHREIPERGFSGGRSTGKADVAHLRTSPADGTHPTRRAERAPVLSPRAFRWLLARERTDREPAEHTHLDHLLQVSEEVRAVQAFLHRFLSMVRERTHQQVRPWMEEAITSGRPERKRFVTGSERDDDAGKDALRLPWSQGPTEGNVNTLKPITSMMDGRAGFRLLRQRRLHDA
jgi:transposase